MKKLLIILTLTIFTSCLKDNESKGYYEKIVTAKVLAETIFVEDSLNSEKTEHMILVFSDKEKSYVALNGIKEFTYEKGFEYELSLKKFISRTQDSIKTEYYLIKILSKKKVE